MGMPNMQNMMKQVQKMQAQMEKVQAELENKTVATEVGGGAIKVIANGKQQIVKIEIEKEVINPDDKEMLEDLVLAGVNKALEEAGKMASDEMGKVTAGMLPPGMGNMFGL